MYAIKPVDHTADRGIAVEADTPEEIFAGAATGMFGSMVDLAGLATGVARTVDVEAPDREALLVAWLQELLYLSEVDGLVFSDFRIDELTPTRVRAEALGCAWPGDRGRTGAAVKAVTYYGLKVEQARGRWRARVTFDV